MEPVVLYAMPASLYSGKAPRRTSGTTGSTMSSGLRATPATARRSRRSSDGGSSPCSRPRTATIVQDTVDIIDYLDADVPPDQSAYPATAVHRTVAHLLELFGGEGLLRPAMHYRWDFDDVNVPFLTKDFSAVLAVGADDPTRDAVFAFASERMRSATGSFGVAEELVPEIERSYEEFLDTVRRPPGRLAVPPRWTPDDRRLRIHGAPLCPPGPRPLPVGADETTCPTGVAVGRADERARPGRQRVRRCRPGACSPTTACRTPCVRCWPTSDEEYLDEAVAQVASVDAWLADHPEVRDGEVVLGKPKRRISGTTTFLWRGRPMTVAVVPYRIFLIKRIQDAFAAAAPGEQAVIRGVFDDAGLDLLLDIRPRRWVVRADNREVWGAMQVPVLPG